MSPHTRTHRSPSTHTLSDLYMCVCEQDVNTWLYSTYYASTGGKFCIVVAPNGAIVAVLTTFAGISLQSVGIDKACRDVDGSIARCGDPADPTFTTTL